MPGQHSESENPVIPGRQRHLGMQKPRVAGLPGAFQLG